MNSILDYMYYLFLILCLFLTIQFNDIKIENIIYLYQLTSAYIFRFIH